MIYKRTLILSIIFFLIFSGIIKAEAMPEISAQAYVLMDAKSGRILKSHNANTKLPIASTTKIMTAILALETIENLNQRIEVPPECCGIEGSSIYLQPKQSVSVIDLLYGTMLRSGNDAAAVLAKFAGRNDSEGFIAMMNKKAKELGALNTNFVNASGLHDDNHYSTAYDLALISAYAMKNDTFRKIAASEKYRAESMNNIFYNKNKVVYQYKYGTGIKIGYTKAAGRCLVASAEKDGTEIIAVLLNDNNWFNDAYKIFDWAFENYKTYSIVEKGQFVRYSPGKIPIFIDDGFRCALTDKEIGQIRFEADLEPVHMANDSEVRIWGTYNIYLGENKLHTGRLISK